MPSDSYTKGVQAGGGWWFAGQKKLCEEAKTAKALPLVKQENLSIKSNTLFHIQQFLLKKNKNEQALHIFAELWSQSNSWTGRSIRKWENNLMLVHWES